MSFTIDLQNTDIYLAYPNKDFIGNSPIPHSYIKTERYFNNISAITFDSNRFIDGKENELYDKIEIGKLVLLVGIGWFQISSVDETNNGITESKTIKVLSLENELCTKIVYSFGDMGDEDDKQGGLDRYALYDSSDLEHSILHIVVGECPSWRIGHVDKELCNYRRTVKADDVDVYSFLTDTVAETFECIFQFNTFEKTINAYKLENIGKYTDIVLSYDNLVKQIQVQCNLNDYITCYNVYGGDDCDGGIVNIASINPTGNNKIVDFSYAITQMPKYLADKVNLYLTEYNRRVGNYTTETDILLDLQKRLTELEHKVPSVDTSVYDDQIQELQDQITDKELQINEMPAKMVGNVDIVHRTLSEYTDSSGNIGYRVLESFCYSPTWTSNTLILSSTYKNGAYSDQEVIKDLIDGEHANGRDYRKFELYMGEYSNSVIANSLSLQYNTESHNLYTDIINNKILIYNLSNEKADYINGTSINYEDWSQYGLAELQTKMDELTNQLALYIGRTDETAKTLYNQTYNKIYGAKDDATSIANSLVRAIKTRKEEIEEVKALIEMQNDLRKEQVLSLRDYLTEKEYEDLDGYIRMQTFNDDSFVITDIDTDDEILEMKRELLKFAQGELSKVSAPQYTFTVDSANFTKIPEFKRFAEQLELGNIINVKLAENNGYEVYVESRLLKVEEDSTNPTNFRLTFSSKNTLDDGLLLFKEIKDQANSTANSLSLKQGGWNNAKYKAQDCNSILSGALDAAKNKLTTTTNQEFIFDGTGIRGRKWLDDAQDFSDTQIWITNDQIAFSSDKFRNVNMALGNIFIPPFDGSDGFWTYGLAADSIVGNMILSKGLRINNENNTIMLDKNGANFKNCDITIEKGNNKILLNASDGISIKNGSDKVLYLDTNGNLQMTGTLTSSVINGGTITGAVINSGDAVMSNGTISGAYFFGGNINIANKFVVDSSGNITLFDENPYNLRDGLISIVSNDNSSGTYMNSKVIFIINKTDDCRTILGEDGISTDGYMNAKTIEQNGNKVIDTSTFYYELAQYLNTRNISVTTIDDYGGYGKYIDFVGETCAATPSWTMNYIASRGYATTSYVDSKVSSSSSSDLRFKKNITNINDTFKDVYMDFKVKQYKFKDGVNISEPNKIHFGLIAQQVNSNLISHNLTADDYDLVETINNNESYDSLESLYTGSNQHYKINYENLHGMHIMMIQEQQKEIEMLKSEIAELKEMIK